MRLRSPLAVLLTLGALALTACGDTLQDQPIARAALEPLVLEHHYPVYWLGGVFHRLAITAVDRDPSGAYAIHYGDCIEGGQYTCVSPLLIVTSPDNSFLPGGSSRTRRAVALRGVRGVLAQQGATIAIPTGGVIVSVYATTPALARAAAQTMVAVNRVGVPGAPLPGPLPDTGFAQAPLPSQEPVAVRLPEAASPRAAGARRSSSASGRTGAPRRR